MLTFVEAGVVPDALYGCSAGALNAAFYAGRPGHDQAHELATWWTGPVASSLSRVWPRCIGERNLPAPSADLLWHLPVRPLSTLVYA